MNQIVLFLIVAKSFLTDRKVVDLFGKTYVVDDKSVIRRIR